MIVVAEPRSGATKFCIDLAEKHGKVFHGELLLCNMNEDGYQSLKPSVHETAYDVPPLNYDNVHEVLFDKPDDVYLCNNELALAVINKADYIVMRKSHVDTVVSVLNFWLRLNKQAGVELDVGMGNPPTALSLAGDNIVRTTISFSYFLCRYCVENNIKPVWYEDMPYSKPVATETLDTLYNKDWIVKQSLNIFNNYDMEFFKQTLLTKFP